MTQTKMSPEQLLDFILSRRTCYQFIDKKIAQDDLHKCLAAAISAPNHKLTQPWGFFVTGDKIRQSLAHIYADNRASKNANGDQECYQLLYGKAVAKFEAIPQMIFMTQNLASDEFTQKEDYAACSCAIQNFQLMAWSLSIGMQWSTGPIINDPRTYELLGIDQTKQQIIGVLYMGYIDADCQPKNSPKRKTVEQVTEYFD